MASPRERTALRASILVAGFAAYWLAVLAFEPARVGRSAGPPPLSADERREVLATLELANRIYADFFASGGAPAMLDDYPAARGLKHRVFRDIGFLRDRGLLQIQDLAEAIPLSVERTGEDTAEVLMYEEWNYLIQRAADRSPVTEVKGLAGGFRYALRRAGGGRWVIASWEPEEVSRPASPPEFKY